MNKKNKCAQVVDRLKNLYPDAVCSLVERDPLRLLIAVRLSAQCTDARVNLVTPVLFDTFPTLDALCAASVEDIEDIIKPCGLFHTKARDISGMCAQIRDRFGGSVPDTMEELLSLPGVGRKTANLVLGDIYGKPAIVTDTHCIRISNRLGLAQTKDPYKVEMALKEIVDPAEGNNLCHRFVLFGRDVCTARSPKCGSCILADICRSSADN